MRKDLPAGTVTLLFTDIEGSTRLLHELGDRYAEVLGEHRRVLRKAFARHGGVEVDTQGDALFFAFARASDALAAADAAQGALAAGPVRVRIGIHTGEPIVTGEGYVGMDVHKGARIAAAGHGRQVLVSEQAARLASGGGLVDLGVHRLKDLTAGERIFQLGAGEFPPLKTLHATNLPVAASPLIGREAEVEELVALLGDGAHLVTVVGPGGTGKTRLALQVAAELVDEFQDGVFWVPLQALADPALVFPTIAQTLGAKAGLAAHLRSQRTLLLLDNLEQLLAAAPALAELLAVCPDLKVLVTSRAPLRVAGEHEFVLDPLPDRDALTLFVERARSVGRRLEPDATVAAICRRLDNLPLALELAAARTKLLDAPALLARLERSLPLLTGGRRDAPERQRTLRATIAWSYDLLEPEAKRLLARLAVFSGSFSLAAAEEVCGADLDAVAALVELSLLKPIGDDRFLLLETIAEYAAEQLEARGEFDELRHRHGRWFRHLPSTLPGAEDGYRGPVSALAPDHANLRAAVERGLEEGEYESVASVVQSTWVYLDMAGHLTEGIGWAERTLDGPLSRAARSQVRLALGELFRSAGDLGRAASLKRDLLEEAAAGDEMAIRWRPGVLADLCDIAVARGELRAARRYAEESLAYSRHPRALGSLGNVAMLEGNLDESEAIHLEAEALEREAEELGRQVDPSLRAFLLLSLAHVARRKGDALLAARRLTEAAVKFASLGDSATVGDCLDGFALLAADAGDLERAGRLLGAGEALRQAAGRERFVWPDHVEPVVSDAARRAGAAMTLEEALALAFDAGGDVTAPSRGQL